ncbi:MAG: pentapeptide repeat-containing protein, partial [Planctomycetes bacterium]|nr:pentapeptide repeat-containing protein [Planctomycetota bacterium]
NLNMANLADAQAIGCQFVEANLKNADCTGANLEMAIFLNADLSEASFVKANLSKCFADGAKAQKTVFQGANLSDAILTHMHMELADFRDANLTAANVHASLDDGANYSGANTKNLKKTDLDLLIAEKFSEANEADV